MADILIDPKKLKAAVRRAGRDPHRVIKMLKKWAPLMDSSAPSVLDEKALGKLVEESRGRLDKALKFAEKHKDKKPNPHKK